MFRRSFREDIDDHVPMDSQPMGPAAARIGQGDVGWIAFGPAITFSILATTVVVLRWYARCRLVRCIGLDDYVILLSLLLSWAMCGVIGAAVHEGVGQYSTLPGALDTVMVAKLIVASNSLWSITINITKASILTQYLRIFSGRAARACCWILMAALVPAVCWGIFGGIFLCSPTSKLWNPMISGHCRNAQNYWVSVAAVDIGLDFLVLLLPLPSISGLHLPKKQKILTMLMFLLGFLVCIVSVVRLATVLITARMGDIVMSGIWSIIWSVVEANVGIICASLLSLKSVLVKIFPKLLEENELPKHQMRLPHIPSSQEPIWENSGPVSSEESGKRDSTAFIMDRPPSSQPSVMRDMSLSSPLAWSMQAARYPGLGDAPQQRRVSSQPAVIGLSQMLGEDRDRK